MKIYVKREKGAERYHTQYYYRGKWRRGSSFDDVDIAKNTASCVRKARRCSARVIDDLGRVVRIYRMERL